MFDSTPELSLQAVASLGLSGKKFCNTKDILFALKTGDSARLVHTPAFIPPSPYWFSTTYLHW
eukprot:Gb_37047 [translate_table: standard]